MVLTSHGAVNQPSDVFISLSGRDKEVAERLATALRGHGLSVWIYTDDDCFGEHFLQRIREAVRASKYVVFLISQGWLESWYCEDEVHAAATFQKPFAGIVIDDCDPTTSDTWSLMADRGHAMLGHTPSDEEIAHYAELIASKIVGEPPMIIQSETTSETSGLNRIAKGQDVPRAPLNLPITERISGDLVLVKVNPKARDSGLVRTWLDRECSRFSYGTASWRFPTGEYRDKIRPSIESLIYREPK